MKYKALFPPTSSSWVLSQVGRWRTRPCFLLLTWDIWASVTFFPGKYTVMLLFPMFKTLIWTWFTPGKTGRVFWRGKKKEKRSTVRTPVDGHRHLSSGDIFFCNVQLIRRHVPNTVLSPLVTLHGDRTLFSLKNKGNLFISSKKGKPWGHYKISQS